MIKCTLVLVITHRLLLRFAFVVVVVVASCTGEVFRISCVRLCRSFNLYIASSSIMGGGHHHHTPGAMPRAEQDLELLKKAQVPLNVRDNCAHLLVDLNSCRRETFFNPAQCQHQRHIYEECQYIAWLARVEKKKELAKQAA